MKKILLILGVVFYSTLTAQLCSRTVSKFVAGPTGYAISGSAILQDSIGNLSIEFSKDFTTTSGPDLYVYLAQKNESPSTSGNSNFIVALLDSNAGAQRYNVPSGAMINSYDYVLIHCKQYDHFWGGGLLDSVSGNCLLSNTIFNRYAFVAQVKPNPFTGETTISMSSDQFSPYDVFVTDVSGRLIQYKSKVASNSIPIGSDLIPGFYFIKIVAGEKSSIIKILKY